MRPASSKTLTGRGKSVIHALFVAYAPVKNPRYAISVVVEHGGSGSSMAAPIAKKILEKMMRSDQGISMSEVSR